MGKVLLISFEENEEAVLNEMLNYFNAKGYLIPFNAFPDGSGCSRAVAVARRT